MSKQIFLSTFLVFISISLKSQQLADTLWSDSFGGSSAEAAGFGNANFGSPSVSAVNHGGYLYLLSYSASNDNYVPGNNGDEDVFILKIEENTGDTVWTRNFGGSDTERAYDLLIHSDNYIFIAGRTSSDDGDFSSNNGLSDAFLIKIDFDGDLIWARNYGGDQIESFYGIVEAPNGNIVAVGEAGSSNGDLSTVNVGTGFAWIIELDSDNGDIEWQDVTAGIQDPTNPDHIENFWDVLLLDDGSGYVAVGTDGDFNDFSSDNIMVMKYDLAGDKVWEKGYGSNQRDWAAGIVEHNNKLYIAGNAGGPGGDVAEFYGVTDVWVLELDLNGDLVEEKIFGGSDLDYPYGIVVDNSTNQLLITGITRSQDEDLDQLLGFGGIDAWAFYINPENLELIEQYRWGGSADDFAHQAVFKNSNNSPIIVGRTDSNDEYFNKDFNSRALFATAFSHGNLSIDEHKNTANDFKIFPNPTANSLTFEINHEAEVEQILIIDSQGRIVYKASSDINTTEVIDVQGLNDGVYQVVVKSKTTVFTKKFIKKS